MIHNVHERRIAASTEQVGLLLESLGSAGDRLWPGELWIPLELDRPVAVGARGGHADIRYTVTEHVPGRRLVFRFDPPTPLTGTHGFDVREHPDGGTLLRHELDAEPHGTMRLLAPLVVRWVHDAVVEDALDRAERSIGVGPASPARWSPYVRLLRRLAIRPGSVPVHPVAVREDAAALAGLSRPDLADAFGAVLPAGSSRDAREWHQVLVAAGAPRWVEALVRVRAVLARSLRLRTAGAMRAGNGPFTVLSAQPELVVAGEDDKHLDFRVLIEVLPDAAGGARLVLTTVVQRHNAIGRAYFALVRPFHRVIVRAILRRAVQRAAASRPRASVPFAS